MKNIICVLASLIFILFSCESESRNKFNQYFSPATMRIDYFHSGNAVSEKVVIDRIYQYAGWAGTRVNLIDTLDYGAYYYRIYDSSSGEEIYSKGFDSYFKEYQLTTPAINGEVKEYHESAIIPFPKSPVIFALEKRDREGKLHEVFRSEVNPSDAEDGPFDTEIKLYTSLESGDPAVKADILIVGEGYTKEEDQKFQDDLKRFTNVFFQAEPCKSYKESFNITGVLKYSEDSGVDEPGKDIDKNTAVNASFNSLGSARYLLTEDNKSLRDIAGHVPYDALYIMVNSSRYGGGGIYNFYCVYTADNEKSDYLMVHEFGHSFFGLADEYYSSSTAYNDFYTTEHEPNEPNITALKDPENIKWKHLLSEGIDIPTEWGKKEYDSLQQVSPWNHERINSIIQNKDLLGKVGAFEGAGYMYEGMYRPSLNCIMFSHVDYFCPVCQDAMIKVIKFYSE